MKQSVNALILFTKNSKDLLESKYRINPRHLIMILTCLILFKNNYALTMDHLESASHVANAIIDHNVQRAEALLQVLRNGNLTDEQLRDINNIINRTIIEQDPNNQYAVNQLNLQNTGVPHEDVWTIRQTMIALGIAASCTITIYLIFHYWDDIKQTLWSLRSLGRPTLQAIVLSRFELVRNNPHVINNVEAYIHSFSTVVDSD